MATATVLTSANGMLSLLDEPDDTLKIHALHQLNLLVDRFWAEIATELPKIEVLYEDEHFKDRSHAALVASKVFYHLEELDDALKYALGAGDLFDVSQSTEYVETLIAKCIDSYITQRVRSFEPAHAEEKIDERLISVVERMFERCYRDGKYTQAIGIALESRRLDQLRKAILTSGDVKTLTSYTYQLSQTVVSHRGFRHQVLQTLIEIYRGLEIPDYISMCQCLLFLNDANSVADILHTLVKKGGDDLLMAYQVAFDLNENENQPFLLRVINALPKVDEPSPAVAPATPTASPAATSTDTATPMETDETKASTTPSTTPSSSKPIDSYELRMKRLKSILSGETPTDLYLHFLYEHNHTDLNILKQIKDKLEARNSVTHNATVMAHGFMHVGTTVDTFLRDNLEWLSRAQNWAKFTATASIGVIHKGHHKESLKLLQPYLPSPGTTGNSPYQEGGALYALGLIHANNGGSQSEYLMEALRNAGTNEIVQHGACLGLGLTAMATDNMTIFEALKNIVMQESAVAGEAAGLAMGLVLLGTGNGEALDIMLAYAHETQHEKIIRGLALGLAMVVYGREEEADVLIEQILTDKDPILRYGAMYAIAMAYVATSNNHAIQKLLHIAVSDVNDDVRRAAVTALGFVLANQPEQVPRVVALLAESYNPHVRYGACIAVGIACAGTAMKEGLALLEPLLRDRVDFVRQGAFIAMGMVLIQHNETKEPKVGTLRRAIADAMASKGDTMTKMGAILAAGIMDAGGRNVTITLLSPAGHKKMAAIVGLAIFPQFWYWYPDIHFLSLAFTPTAFIGLNQDLEIPAPFKIRSNAPPSLYAYPTPIELKQEEKKVEKKKATLSVTAKVAAKKLQKSGDEMDVDMEEKTKSDADSKSDDKNSSDDKKDDAKKTDDKKDTDKKEDESTKTTEKKEEPTYQDLSNPERVTLTQQHILSLLPDQRYQPVKETLSGFILLRDTRPSEPEQLVVPSAPKIGVPGIGADEPEPPAPFTYLG